MLLASRGGRNSTSTELAGYWGVDSREGGLHQLPLFVPVRLFPGVATFSSAWPNTARADGAWPKKGGAGGAAGRSGVGDGGYVSRDQFGLSHLRGLSPSTALASSRTTPRAKIVMTLSPASAEPTSRSLSNCESSALFGH